MEITKEKDLVEIAAFGEKKQLFESMDENLQEISKSGIIGIEKVLTRINEIEASSRDMLIPLRDMRFRNEIEVLQNGENEVSFQNVRMTAGKNDQMFATLSPKPFSTWGIAQMCGLIGVPVQYIRKCVAEKAGDIATINLNFWLDQLKNDCPEKDLFVRMTDDRICGILSNRYSAFDDSVLLDIIREAIPSDIPLTIANQSITPELTKIRVIMQEKQNIGGEELSVGFDISNSRVGRSSIKVQLLVYRWICTNGMIMGGGAADIYRRRHSSVNAASAVEEIGSLVSGLPQLIENLDTWVSESKGNILTSDTLEKHMHAFKRVYNSDACCDAIYAKIAEKYDRTLWGLTNAITEVAQDYSVITREAMERYAGNIFRQGK